MLTIYNGDIGDDQREVETFPLTEPVREPATVPATPETVPA